MEKLVNFILGRSPLLLGMAIAALLGPTLRSYPKLKISELGMILGSAGMLIEGNLPVFEPIGAYTASEHEDLARAVADMAYPLYLEYQPEIVTALGFAPPQLTPGQMATLMIAVGDRLAES